jgi:hypothetical protein
MLAKVLLGIEADICDDRETKKRIDTKANNSDSMPMSECSNSNLT